MSCRKVKIAIYIGAGGGGGGWGLWCLDLRKKM